MFELLEPDNLQEDNRWGPRCMENFPYQHLVVLLCPALGRCSGQVEWWPNSERQPVVLLTCFVYQNQQVVLDAKKEHY